MFGDKLKTIEKAAASKNIGKLVKLTMDKDVSIAKAALLGLGQVKEDDSFNAIVPFLSSTNNDLRSAAATAMGDLGNNHGKAFLINALGKEQDAAVKEAIEAACRKLKEY